ncbi:hypothetical protein CN173_30320, partial [Sinorhizobium meliloti]
IERPPRSSWRICANARSALLFTRQCCTWIRFSRFASIPWELNPSPSACFCPQSELCRCSMGPAEDRLANLLEAQSLVLLIAYRPNPSIVRRRDLAAEG